MSTNWKMLVAAVGVLIAGHSVRADWIWERRDANQANLFGDLRARRVGDLLTIVIDENTGSDAQEKREMEKKTSATGNVNGNGSSSSLGSVLRSFAFDFTLSQSSDRKFDGKANSTIARTFTDRLTVCVVGVEPNGFLQIEGYRTRTIGRETRILRVNGVAPGLGRRRHLSLSLSR